MNQLELFRATCAHEPHEDFLFYANFTPDLKERVEAEFGIAELTAGKWTGKNIFPVPPEKYTEPDFDSYYSEEERVEGSYLDRFGVLHVPGSMYHFSRKISPLRNASSFDEIESFPYPSVEGFSDAGMAEQVKDIHSQGLVAQVGIGHMYETSWQIRGYQEFLMDMLINPEWCEYILDQLKERNKLLAVMGARAAADMLHTGDDVANQNTLMFSKEQWRKYMKPRWAEVYAAARDIKPDIEIWYHSDGNIEEIIPDLIEIGVTILNPVQPECLDPETVKEKWGDKLVLDGTIGTQTTMPFGTPDEVSALVRERAEKLGDDGGLILSPTHILEPEVPLENIKAFFDTCRELKKLD